MANSLIPPAPAVPPETEATLRAAWSDLIGVQVADDDPTLPRLHWCVRAIDAALEELYQWRNGTQGQGRGRVPLGGGSPATTTPKSAGG